MTPRFIGGALLAAVAAGPAFVLMTLGSKLNQDRVMTEPILVPGKA